MQNSHTQLQEKTCLSLYLVCRALSFHLYRNAKDVYPGCPEHFTNVVHNQRAFDLSKKLLRFACLFVLGAFRFNVHVCTEEQRWDLQALYQFRVHTNLEDLQMMFFGVKIFMCKLRPAFC